MNRHDLNSDPSGVETQLRERLHRLADHAPATVVYPDEIRLAAAQPQPVGQRRWFRIGVPLIALIAGGGITAVATTGQNDGGAATPAEAVQHLMDSVEHEDVLGALDTMVPEEVAAFRRSLDDVKSEATRVGLLDEKLVLSGIAGLDIHAEGLQLQTEELGDSLAIVRATGGTVSTAFDPATFPFGGPLLDVVGDKLHATSATADFAASHPFLATVQRDGRWYVSLTYSAAEALRRQTDLNVPPALATAPEGFETPEAAAEAFYQRLVDLDLSGLTAIAAPGEGEALARYAPMWIPQADAKIGGARDEGLTLALSGLQVTATGSGSFRSVTPTEYRITGTTPPGWFDNSDSGPPFDAALPTVVFNSVDGTMYLLAAGEPIPATIDGLQVYNASVDVPTNWLQADADGTIQQPVDPTATPVTTPLPFTIDHVDGCTTTTGEAATRMKSLGYPTSGDTASCQDERAMGPGLMWVLVGGGSSIELPSIEVTEQHGKWYLSPIGTIVDQATSVLKPAADGDMGIDNPLAIYLYGTTRPIMNQMLTVSQQPIPAECEAIVDAATRRLVAHPDPKLIRPCTDAFGGGGLFTRSGGVTTVIAGGSSVVDGQVVSADTAPVIYESVPPNPVDEPATTLVGG